MRNLLAILVTAATGAYVYFMITPEQTLFVISLVCLLCGILIFMVWGWAVKPELDKLPKYQRGSWWNTWKP